MTISDFILYLTFNFETKNMQFSNILKLQTYFSIEMFGGAIHDFLFCMIGGHDFHKK